MSPNKLFQFDLRSILAFTCAVAAVFAVGREDPVIGVVLALLLGVAGLVSVNLANPTDRRGRAFFFAVGFGFLGFILGMGIQCLLWGISSRITWIPLLFTCISTIAGGLAGARKSVAKQVWMVLSVLGFMLIIWVSYRYQISSAERWVASKKLGVVPEFSVTVPQNYGSDHRSSETNLDWLRRVLGITYTTQLYLYEPIDDVEWKHLANLHELNRLDIHEVKVSPEKLQHICNLQNLKSLGFW